jgi:hypothetical protein
MDFHPKRASLSDLQAMHSIRDLTKAIANATIKVRTRVLPGDQYLAPREHQPKEANLCCLPKKAELAWYPHNLDNANHKLDTHKNLLTHLTGITSIYL